MPVVALLPAQLPAAVQEVAFVEDQVNVEEPLYATDAGLATSDTVGGGGGGGPELPPPPPQEDPRTANRTTTKASQGPRTLETGGVNAEK